MNKQKEVLLKNSQLILDEISKTQKCDVEVCASYHGEMKVIYEATDFSISTSHTSSMYGIRAVVDGRLGFTTTNASDAESLKQAAREVLMVAKLSPPGAHHKIAEKKFGINRHFECFDKDIAEMPVESAYQYAQRMIDIAKSDPRLSIDRGEFSISSTDWTILSTNGIEASTRQSVCSWSALGMGKTKDEVTSLDYDGGSTAILKGLDEKMNTTMGRFRDSSIRSLGAKKGESYKGLVLLHPEAVMDLIAEHVEFHCNGRIQQDGMSTWRDKMGETVAATQLTIFEDPTDKTRIEGWSPFDREGVKTQKHSLIDAGKLSFVAHNCFSAHRGNTNPTGNGVGGVRSMPNIGFGNVTVCASRDGVSETELYKTLKNGLVIKRFSGNSDPTSGIFSGVAKNSWWIRNGEFAHPVQEVMVSGNGFDLLKNIVKMGKDLHSLLGGSQAPYVLVDGMTVTAAK